MGKAWALGLVWAVGCGGVGEGQPCEADPAAPYAAYGAFACDAGQFLVCEDGTWVAHDGFDSSADASSTPATSSGSPTSFPIVVTCGCDPASPDEYYCNEIDY